MFFRKKTPVMMLVSLTVLLIVQLVLGRSVNPLFDGAQGEFIEDLQVAAAEPRPVVMDVMKHPEVFSHAYEDAAFSDSEKVEKILRRPYSFSYRNRDQKTSPSKIHPQLRKHFGEDQKPSAINYYKYVEDIEKKENNEKQKQNEKEILDADAGEHVEAVDESEDQLASKESGSEEELELNHNAKYSSDNEDTEENDNAKETEDHENTENFNRPKYSVNHEDLKEEHNAKEPDDHEDVKEKHHETDELYDYENIKTDKYVDVKENKHEVAGSHPHDHEDVKDKEHQDAASHHLDHEDVKEQKHESAGSHPHDHEDVKDKEHQDAASHHLDHEDVKEQKHEVAGSHQHEQKHGVGGNSKHKKGGGKSYHSDHKSSHGEKGDKGYKGEHYHEKGEKGHHTKEKHNKHYEEKGGEKKKNHHDDGYHAEHHHGEKGEKGHKFEESGEHHKGHNTKGEHNIRKTDEYEKKQEFFDESHEEGDFEKDGGFYHESDYKKGGHEKGGFKKGADEEGQHGKKNHYEKGGHFKEEKGHKESAGHDKHHDHHHKHGKKEKHSGGKKWHFKKGDGDGGDNHGKHSEQKLIKAHRGDVGSENEASSSSIREKSRILLSPMLAYNGLFNGNKNSRQREAAQYTLHETANNDGKLLSHIVLPLENESATSAVIINNNKEPRERKVKNKNPRRAQNYQTIPNYTTIPLDTLESYYSSDAKVSPQAQRKSDDYIEENSAQDETSQEASHVSLPLGTITFDDIQESRNAEIQAIKRSTEQHENSRKRFKKKYDTGSSVTEETPKGSDEAVKTNERYDTIKHLIRGESSSEGVSSASIADSSDAEKYNDYKVVQVEEQESKSLPATVATYIVRRDQTASNEADRLELLDKQPLRRHRLRGDGFCGTVDRGSIEAREPSDPPATKEAIGESEDETTIAAIVVEGKDVHEDLS